MFAVWISEVSGWVNHAGKRTLLVFIWGMAICGCITKLRPEICFQVMTALFIWFGLLAGKQRWSDISIHEWIEKVRFEYWKVVAGKFLATVSVGLVHLMIFIPVVVMMKIMWGVRWSQFGIVAVYALLAMVTAALIGLFFYRWLLDEDRDEIYVNSIAGGWLVLSGAIRSLRGINPFYQVWRVMAPEAEVLWQGMLFGILLILVLAVLQVKFLQREVKRRHE